MSKIDLDAMKPADRAWFEASMANPPPALTPEGMRLNFLSVALTDARAAFVAAPTDATRAAYESALLAALVGGLDVDVDHDIDGLVDQASA